MSLGGAQAASVATGTVAPALTVIPVAPGVGDIEISYLSTDVASQFDFLLSGPAIDYPFGGTIRFNITLTLEQGAGTVQNNLRVIVGGTTFVYSDGTGTITPLGVATGGPAFDDIIRNFGAGDVIPVSVIADGGTTGAATGIRLQFQGNASVVPLPAPALLLLSGLGIMGVMRRRAKAQA